MAAVGRSEVLRELARPPPHPPYRMNTDAYKRVTSVNREYWWYHKIQSPPCRLLGGSRTTVFIRRLINTLDLLGYRWTLTSNLNVVVRKFAALGGIHTAELGFEIAADVKTGDEVDEKENDACSDERRLGRRTRA
ncbi:hypothetical protein GP486_003519 [Trichoglossum hirsutum]|uniref:Uncharacterized protein n=1 Tax=Trichoglossum hirsutum TaxID=265104 RepID=A0A9P8LCY8_9PEZI|nr:hypothetical protein GP486_003519 [Trichoglossum hirsutum]